MPPLSIPERQALIARIEGVLDGGLRAELCAVGSRVEVVGIDDDRIVQVRFAGACQGCSSAIMTQTFALEAAVKAAIPEVRFVEAVP